MTDADREQEEERARQEELRQDQEGQRWNVGPTSLALILLLVALGVLVLLVKR